MITYAITISEIQPGTIDCRMNSDNEGSELENAYAGILDTAFRSIMEFTIKTTKRGELIEDKNIESYVKAAVGQAIKEQGLD